jgi:hypothetical protein
MKRLHVGRARIAAPAEPKKFTTIPVFLSLTGPSSQYCVTQFRMWTGQTDVLVYPRLYFL